MLNPNMFIKPSYSSQPNSQSAKKIELQKIGGFDRTRWDESIEVPNILYQKFKVPPPQNNKSASFNQVNNNYPPSLIDFIRRAYLKCKDFSQKKQMQKQLKQIIDKNKNNINDVNWDNYLIPNVTANNTNEPTKNSQSYASSNSMLLGAYSSASMMSKPVHKQMITIPSAMSNRSLLDKTQKPSKQQQTKAKQLLNQRLQSFQQRHQKMNNQQQNPTQKAQQKTFIGFKDQKQVRLQMLKQKYQQMSVKNKSQIEQQKKPEPPKIPTSTAFKGFSTNNLQPLQVVQSRAPQKVYEVKKLPDSLLKKSQPTKTPKITKKQLQTIVKSGQDEDLKVVAKRFAQFNKIKPIKHVQVEEQVQQQDLDFKIIGKCKAIDKPYLRITHRPDPQTVRPQAILRKAFNHYKNQYKKGVSYDQIISQFRSIRQDLTVQDIRNSFTVEVYEQNLKMSLFQDDPIQMKQCQTNLWQLYRQGLYNKRADRVKFISYHFIVMILQQRYKQLEYMLTLIPTDVLQQKQIQQSLKLKRHLVLGNYFAFFNFHIEQDQTCQKIMEHYMDKVRVKCLVMACKTFGQKISFKLLAENVGQDEDVLKVLAMEQGAKIDQDSLNLRQSYEIIRNSEHLKVKKVTSLLD